MTLRARGCRGAKRCGGDATGAALAWIASTVVACGAPTAPPSPAVPSGLATRAIAVEWKVVQGDGDLVNVSIVVDGKTLELGTLPAATEMEPGTPHTCALRVAHSLRTELTCGDLTSMYAAELVDAELVIHHAEGAAQRVVMRVPVSGDALAVAPYRLPE